MSLKLNKIDEKVKNKTRMDSWIVAFPKLNK